MDKSNEFQSPQVQNPGRNVVTKNKGGVARSIEFRSPPIQNLGRNATSEKKKKRFE